jgi:dihydroxyacid dehydratase/phosphogluconate dehydratase
MEGERNAVIMGYLHEWRELAAGIITEAQLIDRVIDGIPSAGYCNTMGTASTMNSIAEALGMSLPRCGTIPAPYAERAQMAYTTGRRIVEMVDEDLTPSRILTREAFENAIVVNSAIGGSGNCPHSRQRDRPAHRRKTRHSGLGHHGPRHPPDSEYSALG